MERYCFTFFALLSFAVGFWTHKPIFGIILFVLLADCFTILVLIWSIPWVASSEFILAMALYALNDIHHFTNGFGLDVLILFIANQCFYLVLIHYFFAVFGGAYEAAPTIDKLIVNILFDAGQAKQMPTFLYIK